MDRIAFYILEINLYFSIFVLFCGCLLFFAVYSCLKNVNQNLKFLYFPMLVACFVMPASNLYLGFVINPKIMITEFNIVANVLFFSIYFMRSVDCAISVERFVATIFPAIYEQKRFLILGPILLMLTVLLSLIVGNVLGLGRC